MQIRVGLELAELKDPQISSILVLREPSFQECSNMFVLHDPLKFSTLVLRRPTSSEIPSMLALWIKVRALVCFMNLNLFFLSNKTQKTK